MTDSVQISKSLREWVEATTQRTMRDQSRYVKSLGFSMPQFFMLMQVYYKKQCGISDLSDHMEITAAAASQTVEKLVQAGYLDRAEDPSDRRAKQITLSAKGRDLIEKSIAARFRWVDDLVKTMSSADKVKVHEALVVLTEAVKQAEKQ
jgi:DNA-binding MarR family transcriptional regulator